MTLAGPANTIAFGFHEFGNLVRSMDSFSNFENIRGGLSADTLTGDGGGNIVRGGNGGDIIDGAGGNDTPNGERGADSLRGGDGNDVLAGTELPDPDAPPVRPDTADDTLDGGSGGDTADYALAEAAIAVTLRGSAAATLTMKGAGTDTLLRMENVIGGAGDDRIVGHTLANRLVGGAGDDTLGGGAGRDTLVGGAGDDTFLFATRNTAHADIVDDFRVADDTIQLARSAYTTLDKGKLAAAEFWKSAAGVAHDGDDRVVYETDTGSLTYDSNGDRAGGITLIATLDKNLALTAGDIFVV